LVLATLSLVLYAFLVAPHVHAMSDNPRDCPVWAAHGAAGAAVETPDIALEPPTFATVVSDRAPQSFRLTSHHVASFEARAPPTSIA
jgi:hypothetical protein